MPVLLADGRDGEIENEAVAVASQPIEVASAGRLIVRELLAPESQPPFEFGGSASECFGEADVEKVEAVAELDDRAEDGGTFDFGAFAAGLLFGPLVGAGRPVFPEIDAAAEPVVGVLAGEEFRFSRQHGIGHPAVAAVEAEDGALVGEQIHS